MKPSHAAQRLAEWALSGVARGALRLVVGLCRRRRVQQLPIVGKRPPRLLVVQLEARLGQVLMTTPLLESLRRRYPSASIDCAVSPYAARVLLDHPTGARLWPTQRYTVLGKQSLWRVWRHVRRRQYDLCFDVNSPDAPSVVQALACRFCGARGVIGYAMGPLARLYDAAVPADLWRGATQHEVQARLALLAPLGFGPTVATPTVGALGTGARPAIRALIDGMRGAPYAVINLGARAAARRVCPADGALVANLCKSIGFRPVIVAGRGEEALCEAVTRLALDVTVAPHATLADLALLFGHAACAISGDAGPMHLAIAVGCPTLGIFSATSPLRFGYSESPHAVIGPPSASDERRWAPLARQFLRARRAAYLACRAPSVSAASIVGAAASARCPPASAGSWAR